MIKWAIVAFVVFGVLFIALPVGLHTQGWARFWFAGSTLNAPGVVPIVAPPHGPLLSDSTDLMIALNTYMGVSYVFGGNDRRGIDCSGLVVAVARALGIVVPWRTAQLQFNNTAQVDTLEVGDLLFFRNTYASPDEITHVGWYVGGGMMISAIEPRVSRQSLAEPFWRAHYVAARRIRR